MGIGWVGVRWVGAVVIVVGRTDGQMSALRRAGAFYAARLVVVGEATTGIVAVAAATSFPSKREGGCVGVRWVGAGVIAHGWMRDAAGRLELCMLQDSANAVVVGFACSFVSQ